MSTKPSFFAELKRRNVLRAGVLYAGAVWALSQGISQLGPSVGAPDWVTRWFLIASAIGFPFWLAFAWFYEFAPSGLKRESEIDPSDSIAHHTSRKLNYWITGVLAVAVVLLLTNTFVLHHGVNEVAATPAAAPVSAPPNSIAVLPFTNESSDKQQDYFADGITEDLLNLLTEVQPLRVAARASSFAFRGKGLAVPEIAAKLHADPRWLPFLHKIGYAPEQLAKVKFTVTLPGEATPAGANGSVASPAVETSATAGTSAPAHAGAASAGQP